VQVLKFNAQVAPRNVFYSGSASNSKFSLDFVDHIEVPYSHEHTLAPSLNWIPVRPTPWPRGSTFNVQQAVPCSEMRNSGAQCGSKAGLAIDLGVYVHNTSFPSKI
jgi:hypothetical protein